MKIKNMILDYCLMYVDIHGTIPDRDKLENLSDREIEILYTDMLILFKKLNKKS